MNGSDSVSIQLAEAGSLETHLKEVEKIDPLKINALKVKGDINGSDLKLIREMAGSGLKKDDKTEGQLVRLDLSEASFKQGGDAFFVYESSDGDELCLLTVDNSLPRYAFGYTRLRQLQLPEGITRVSSQAFYHCDSLRSVNIPSTVQEIGRSAFSFCMAAFSSCSALSLLILGCCCSFFCCSLSCCCWSFLSLPFLSSLSLFCCCCCC